MVKTFTYVTTKKDGTVETKERKVFVMSEDAKYIRGIDLTKLTDAQAKSVIETFADRPIDTEVKFGKSEKKIENFNEEWNAGWRTFNKTKIKTNAKA